MKVDLFILKESKMKKIKIGIIGAGQIASNHCGSIARHPDAEVIAVADKSLERAKAIQKQFNVEKVYAKWQDLVSDKDVDAVAVALPNFLHAPVSIAALRAKKHVLLEKPFALNYTEAAKVVKAAEKSGKVFMLGMNQRFGGGSQTARTLVGRGELGDIYHAKAYWLRRSGSPTFGTWFCRKDQAGGGSMLDIGVHVLDLALYIMDNWEPVSVSAAVYTKFGNRGIGEGGWGMSDKGKHVFDVDDFATALIKFKNGATLNLSSSWVLNMEQGGAHNVELFGDKAGLSVFPVKLSRFGKKKGEYEVVEPQNVKIAYPHCDRMINWIDVIMGKDKPMCTAAQALTVQKILDAVYKSSVTGREERLKVR